MNLHRFGEELSTIDFCEIKDMKDDTSAALDRMMGVVQLIYDKTCPVKFLKPRKREPRKPWITIEIFEASYLRNQAYVKYLNSKCAETLEEFEIMHNKLNSMRRKAKQDYFANQLSLNKDNTKGIWKVINDLLGKLKEAPPNLLPIQRKLVNDEMSIMNKFSEFF